MGLNVEKPMLRLSAYTNEDSDGNVMLKAHAYKAQNDGFVTVKCDLPDGNYLYAYVGLTNDPAGAGDGIQSGGCDNAGGINKTSFCFPVAKNEYFEITTNIGGTPVIRWKSHGLTLIKPIDFN